MKDIRKIAQEINGKVTSMFSYSFNMDHEFYTASIDETPTMEQIKKLLVFGAYFRPMIVNEVSADNGINQKIKYYVCFENVDDYELVEKDGE